MTPESRRVNLRDIAEDSGVSIQTVSRVVRGINVVAEETRVRVMASVERLGYRPNLAARSLSAHRTGQVIVLVAVPLLYGHATTFVEVCQELAELQLHAVASIAPPREGVVPDLQDLIPVTADGVIILGGRTEPSPWVVDVAARMPTVLIGRVHSLPPHSAGVSLDHRAGAISAVRHLIDRGARRIVHVAGPQDWIDAYERLAGYHEAIAEADLEPVVLHAGSWDAADAGPLMGQLPEGTDAVFAANDQLALGAMTALQKRGLSVPGDVRVVGFDDMAGVGFLNPGLTTVRQDFRAIGRLAVQSLHRLLTADEVGAIRVDADLIVREST
ncbi:LacI family DNA-binding transcriptional regulator [Tessaracoccus palaemonis]|uniref:LacI family transcriptional regulator n=1 Tax=Tessaracoccus palaemonis TaxID=2829499 RepID=A0ABX8SMC3_9ACTN|nr:LacI family DNA-binding transcriptional regulator [Tessaracoccus palaemonis]QXT63303.1 LacI family transcriptional regulator [Tessaracoccus palaemonis]